MRKLSIAGSLEIMPKHLSSHRYPALCMHPLTVISARYIRPCLIVYLRNFPELERRLVWRSGEYDFATCRTLAIRRKIPASSFLLNHYSNWPKLYSRQLMRILGYCNLSSYKMMCDVCFCIEYIIITAASLASWSYLMIQKQKAELV